MQAIPEAIEILDRAFLLELDELSSGRDETWAFPLSVFVDEYVTKDMAGAICRSLRDRGFVTFERGLFNDDGEVAGSGYAITTDGREYLKTLFPETV